MILLPLMILLIVAQPAYRKWLANQPVDFSNDSRALDSLIQAMEGQQEADDVIENKPALFFFNPNNASVSDLKKLGIPDNLSSRIASYRRKGGQFRVKSDLLKIYGLDSSLYDQLYVYIQLPEHVEKRPELQPQPDRHSKILPAFDLNSADSSQLISVNGIGPVLAARIIKFRNGLGGFVKPQQLHEVYGLDSTAVQQLVKVSFIEENFVPKKINMNTADEKSFSTHPYIKRSIAKAIVAYRFQHGAFTHVEELRKLSVIKPEEADRILPYLKIGD